MREHFAIGIRDEDLRFDLMDVLIGVGTMCVIYRRETGLLVSDLVELDDDAKAIRVDRPRLKRLFGLYGRQHSKKTFPSCAMKDIATDAATAIQKRQAILLRSLPATLKRTRNELQGDSAFSSSRRRKG